MPKKGETTVNEWGWGGKYEKCLGCGTTEKMHQGRGYCSSCYYQAKKDGRLEAAGETKRAARGTKSSPRETISGQRKTLELTIRVTEKTARALEVVAAYAETSPAELVATLVERRFEDAAVKA